MGTDIRAFIEYRSAATRRIWVSFAEVAAERDRRVFEAIAAVPVAGEALPQRRGFPSNAAPMTERAYYVHVIADDEPVTDGLERFVRRSDAESIVALGGHYRDDQRERVSHPDARSPSWITAVELDDALERARIDVDTMGTMWQLIVRTLHALEEHRDTQRARLVFWFEG